MKGYHWSKKIEFFLESESPTLIKIHIFTDKMLMEHIIKSFIVYFHSPCS